MCRSLSRKRSLVYSSLIYQHNPVCCQQVDTHANRNNYIPAQNLFIYRYISGFLDKQQRQQEQLSVELALSSTIALCKYMLNEIQI